MPGFLGEPEQPNAEEQGGGNKEKGRTIGMMPTKELGRKKYRKQERRAYSARQRHDDAVAQQAAGARGRTGRRPRRGPVLIRKRPGRFDAVVDGCEP